MPKPKKALGPSIRAIAPLCAGLTDRIEALAEQQRLDPGTRPPPPSADELKPILLDLYDAISQIDIAANDGTPRGTVVKAWVSLLDPIDSLSALEPHGSFLAARMLLYFIHGFIHARFGINELQKAGPKDFAQHSALLLRLDDMLLGYLKTTWVRSRRMDELKWAFSDYSTISLWTDESYKKKRMLLASATSLDELRELGGGVGRQFWRRKEGDTAFYPLPADATGWSYRRSESGKEPEDPKDRLLEEATVGTDGPLRDMYAYRAADPGLGIVYRHREILVRSRQFALDARKIASANLRKERVRLAQVVFERIHPLPAELCQMVYGYITLDQKLDPYVEKLDLPHVYSPFPSHMKSGVLSKCSSCAAKPTSEVERVRKRSCPEKTIVMWNLPLRAFMSFHNVSEDRNGQNKVYVPCKLLDCHETGGHHEDSTWEMGQSIDVELEHYLTAVIRERHGPDATLDSVGFGPVEDVILRDNAEAERRQEALFNRRDECDDENVEWRWKGIAGLLDTMVHGRSLRRMVVPNSNLSPHNIDPSGPAFPWRVDVTWMFGLRRSDEEALRLIYWDMARARGQHCRYCY
ncbi:hypothetical protein GQ53DRAFT_807307 [Thozetella sp. PMI_491]|nr:hypothetical protein GQ53DRAFT_807307 [Thozetella sp. PMI_491]